MKYFIGIDNGLNGGIVVLDREQNIIEKIVMPTLKINNKNVYDINTIDSWIKSYKSNEIFCCLEKSHVRAISGKRACFMTGFGYGAIQALLISNSISHEIIKPQVWMKELEIDSKGDKKGSILFCKRKWPKENWCATNRCTKEHDGLTDSACLALYSLRKYGGIK